jgi:hypothetical protein
LSWDNLIKQVLANFLEEFDIAEDPDPSEGYVLNFTNLMLDGHNKFNSVNGIRNVVAMDMHRELNPTFNKRCPVRLINNSFRWSVRELCWMYEHKQLTDLYTVPYGYKDLSISKTKPVEQYNREQLWRLATKFYRHSAVYSYNRHAAYERAESQQHGLGYEGIEMTDEQRWAMEFRLTHQFECDDPDTDYETDYGCADDL